MNRAYRLIWNAAKNAWVVAAEIVSGRGKCPAGTVKTFSAIEAAPQTGSASPAVTQPVRTATQLSSLMLALEPRFVFDAAGAATAAVVDKSASDAAAPDKSDKSGESAKSHDRSGEHFGWDRHGGRDNASSDILKALADRRADGEKNGPEREQQANGVIFADPRAENIGTLLAGVKPGIEVVFLDPSKDGIAQISRYLSSHSGISSVYLFSHGTPGAVALGSTTLDSAAISQRSAELAGWSASLTADADILIYGCNVAAESQGLGFIGKLAQVTGADVAASTDATGSLGKGGDWTLEAATGIIEARSPLTRAAMAGYDGLLDAPGVASIVRQTPTAAETNASSVKFLVTFTESVTGVTADSFVIAPGSVSGATVQLVTEVKDSNGKQYEVTIGNLKGGNGTLNIDIADTNSIESKTGGTKLIDSHSYRDDSYTIDTDINVGSVTGINIGSTGNDTIRTNADTGFNLSGTADPGDTVRIYIDGKLAGTTSADAVTGQWNLTYTGDALSAATHTLTVRNSDAAGNLANKSYALIIDTQKPELLVGSNTNVSDIIVELKFDKTLAAGTVPATTNFTVKVNGVIDPTYEVARITIDGDIVRLTLTKDVANGATVTVSYNGTALKDSAGNTVEGFSDKALANLTKNKATEAAPTVTAPTEHQYYSIGAGAVKLFGGDFTLDDTDDPFLERATVTIKNGNDADVLSIKGTLPSGITWSTAKSGGNLVLTLEGHATHSDYQTALGQITFKTTAGAAAYNVVNRSVEVVVSDGQKENSTVATREIRVLGYAFPIGNSTTAYVIGNVPTFGTNANGYVYDLVGVNLVMGTLNPVDKAGGVGTLNDFTTWNLNALGFNPTDGHLYAARQDTGNRYLVRIDADGTVTRVSDAFDGAAGHLPNVGFVTGDIDNYGIMWLYNGNKLYAIDVNAKSNTFGQYLGSFDTKNSGGTNIALGSDMAFNSAGTLYSANTNALITVTISRDANGKPLSITTNSETVTGLASAAMQYCDEDGFFYFNKSGTKLGRLNLTTKELDEVDADPSKTLPSSGDAARLATIRLDYGDAGTLNGHTYRTTFAQNGPRHNQLNNTVWLGPEGEANKPGYKNDGVASNNADSDTDDNGITLPFPALRQGMTTYSVDVMVTGKAGDTLIGWIDFDKDGTFDVNEAASVTLTKDMAGETVRLTWTVPLSITTGDTYARFRIATPTDSWKTAASDGTGTGAATEDIRSYGALMNGEVEDYKIAIQTADTIPPTANTITITGGNGPRSTPVGRVEIKFSESVQNVDIRDFVLTRNGEAITLPADTPITGSGDTWYIDLSKVTSPTGTYELTVKDGAGNGITDDAGNHLANQKSQTFHIDTTAPVIDLDTANGNSRNWSTDSSQGARVSLDNNSGPASVVEEGVGSYGSQLANVQITVGGLRDGNSEVLIFGGSTEVKADGSSGNMTGIIIGSVMVDISYDSGVFTITKNGSGQTLTQAEASEIIRAIEYKNDAESSATNGSRTFSFTAKDIAGVIATPAVATITVTGGGGANGPLTPTVDPQYTNNPTPVITGGTTVPTGGTLEVTVNGETYIWTEGGSNGSPNTPVYDSDTNTWTGPLQYDPATYTWTLTIPTGNELSDKTYDVTVTVTDASHTTSTDITTDELVIDTLPPAIPTVVSQQTRDVNPTITGTAAVGDGEHLEVTVDGRTYTEGDGHLERNNDLWTLRIPTLDPNNGTTPYALIPEQTYDVAAVVVDRAGNRSPDSTSGELLIDTVAPQLDLAPDDTTTLNDGVRSVDGEKVKLDNRGGDAVLTEGNSIASITVVAGGVLDGSSEHLLIGTADISLGTSSTTVNNVTAGGVTGLTVSYDHTTRTISITGTNLTKAQTEAIIRAIEYQDTKAVASAHGDRTFTFTVTDKAGNTSDPAVATVTVSGPMAVDNITVNEASAYAVFTITGSTGETITGLTLGKSGDTATGGGVDYGPNLQYSEDNGATWNTFIPGTTTITIGSSNAVLVRTPVVNDTINEGSETFTLTVIPGSGGNLTATGTIKDDGTGDIFDNKGNKTPTDPNDNYYTTPGNPAYIPRDDDRAVTVNNITVNEASSYGVFTVTGTQGQKITLALTDGNAVSSGANPDFGPGLQYFNGTAWVDYTAGAAVTIANADGTLLVRTQIINDTISEGSETFTLTATPAGGHAGIGTATINDDGTGDIFDPNTGAKTPTDPANPGYITRDDDRAVAVNSITVNEASSYGVFTVTGVQGQKITLTLTDGTAASSGANPDFGPGLQYFDGTTWQNYTAGTAVAITNADGTLLVRTQIINDAISEGSETFTLTVTPVGGHATTGTATIRDDGTGDVFDPVSGAKTPTNPANPGYITRDDDRAIAVNSITVNEASSYGVFTVTGTQGQKITLTLSDGSAVSNGANPDFGPGLQYFNGTAWVDYTAGTAVTIANANGTLLVRTPIINDTISEGNETFTLTATPVGGHAATGTATIRDDGTGDIFDPVSGAKTPTNPTEPGYIPRDNDLTVTSPVVNEASGTAVFEVHATPNTAITLTLTPETADGSGIDFGSTGNDNIQVSVDGGQTWVNYTGGTVTLPNSGTVLIRTPITNDDISDNNETFSLTVTPGNGGVSVKGTATIKDDGTGDIFDNKGQKTPTDPNAPGYIPRNNDGVVFVNDITVNEASSYGVFTVTGTQGQKITLILSDGSAVSNGANPDFGPGLQYFNGTAWVDYTAGTTVTIANADGTLLVRTPIINDTLNEGSETFTLTVTPVGGHSTTGTAVIKDDGTGDIFDNKGNKTPTNPNAPGYIPRGDDRAVTVTSPEVNEKSPYIVYEIDGAPGQKIEVGITGGTATGGGVDYGGPIEYSTDGGVTWKPYDPTNKPEVPASGTVLVRIPLVNDNIPDNGETVELTVTPVGGHSTTGTAIIRDDGTGDIFDNKGQKTPTDPNAPGYIPRDADYAVDVKKTETPPPVAEPAPQPGPAIESAPPTVVTVAPPPLITTSPFTPGTPSSPSLSMLEQMREEHEASQRGSFSMPPSTLYGVVIMGDNDGGNGMAGLYLAKTPSSQESLTEQVSSFNLPSGTFRHSDSSARVALTATLVDGSPLPDWITFDPESGRFTAKPPAGSGGVLDIRIMARDQQGNVAEAQLLYHISESKSGKARTADPDSQSEEAADKDKGQDAAPSRNSQNRSGAQDGQKPQKQSSLRTLKGRPSLSEQMASVEQRNREPLFLAALQKPVAKQAAER